MFLVYVFARQGTAKFSDTSGWALVPAEFDGEARFQRNRRGLLSHFVYYEFGRRLGIARKVT